MISVGSLYSGIAGLELGILAAFAEVGIPTRIVFQVEIDDFCSRVLAHHFPNVTRYRDVAEVSKPGPVDVLVGGFPCTDVSSAGLGRGLGRETRSGNGWHHFARLIDEIQPRWVVVENVASGTRRWLPRVVQDLRVRGYRPRAVPVGAVDVGAPHLRRRVFVVAECGDVADAERSGRHWLPERDEPGHVATNVGQRGPWHGAREALADRDDGPSYVRDAARCEGGHAAGRGSGLADAASGGLGPWAGVCVCGDDVDDHHFGAGACLLCGCVGYAAVPRRAGPDGDERTSREWWPQIEPERSGDAASDGRETESGVGPVPDGISFDVAGHPWPAGRGQTQHAWEPPMVLLREVKCAERPAKLRAIGNAVVPQCALVVGRVLFHLMRERARAAQEVAAQ